MLYIVIPLLIIYTFFSWKYSKYGLVFLLSTLPLYLVRFNIFSIPSTLLEGMILVLLGVCVAKMLVEKNSKEDFFRIFSQHKFLHVALALFIVSGVIATVYSVNTLGALGALKAYIIEPVIVFYLMLHLLRTKKDLIDVIRGTAVVVSIVSVVAIVQYFFELSIPEGYLSPEKRATSIFPYPAALALYLTPLMTLFSIYLLKTKNIKKNILLVVAIFLGLIALVFSGAEGGIGAYFIPLFAFFLFSKNYWKYAFLMGAAALLVVISVPMLREYTQGVITFRDTSGEVRRAIWEGTGSLLLDRPIQGAGLASFPEVYNEYKLDRHVELVLYPHNIILNFWVELGLFGLITFMLLVIYFYTNAYNFIRSRKERVLNDEEKGLMLAALFAMYSLLIYGLVDVPYFKNDLAILFFMIVGFTIILSFNKNEAR